MPKVKLLSSRISPPPILWKDRAWRHVFEDHLPILKKKAKPHEIKTALAREHRGNFYGYLRDIGFESRWHWYLLRINDLHDPSDFDENRNYIMLVEPPFIEELEARYSLQYINGAGTSY